MTYGLVRPSSDPYEAPGYTTLFNSGAHVQLTPTFNGGGSLADDSDATNVQMYASLDGTTERSSIIAVDFAPVPNLLDTAWHGDVVRVLKTGFDVSGSHVCEWLLINKTTGESLSTYPGRFDFHSGLETLSTHTSGTDWYELASGAQDIMRADGFTVAFCIRPTITHATVGDPLHYTFYEFGLQLDLAVAARLRRRPLRQFPRSDGLGMASTRRQDANRSMQASLRRGGGVYF